MTIERPCDVCNRTYEAKRRTSKYCSERCRKRAQRVGLAVVVADPRRPFAHELLQLTVSDDPVPITPAMVDALLVVLDKLNRDEVEGIIEPLADLGSLIQGRAG